MGAPSNVGQAISNILSAQNPVVARAQAGPQVATPQQAIQAAQAARAVPVSPSSPAEQQAESVFKEITHKDPSTMTDAELRGVISQLNRDRYSSYKLMIRLPANASREQIIQSVRNMESSKDLSAARQAQYIEEEQRLAHEQHVENMAKREAAQAAAYPAPIQTGKTAAGVETVTYNVGGENVTYYKSAGGKPLPIPERVMGSQMQIVAPSEYSLRSSGAEGLATEFTGMVESSYGGSVYAVSKSGDTFTLTPILGKESGGIYANAASVLKSLEGSYPNAEVSMKGNVITITQSQKGINEPGKITSINEPIKNISKQGGEFVYTGESGKEYKSSELSTPLNTTIKTMFKGEIAGLEAQETAFKAANAFSGFNALKESLMARAAARVPADITATSFISEGITGIPYSGAKGTPTKEEIKAVQLEAAKLFILQKPQEILGNIENIQLPPQTIQAWAEKQAQAGKELNIAPGLSRKANETYYTDIIYGNLSKEQRIAERAAEPVLYTTNAFKEAISIIPMELEGAYSYVTTKYAQPAQPYNVYEWRNGQKVLVSSTKSSTLLPVLDLPYIGKFDVGYAAWRTAAVPAEVGLEFVPYLVVTGAETVYSIGKGATETDKTKSAFYYGKAAENVPTLATYALLSYSPVIASKLAKTAMISETLAPAIKGVEGVLGPKAINIAARAALPATVAGLVYFQSSGSHRAENAFAFGVGTAIQEYHANVEGQQQQSVELARKIAVMEKVEGGKMPIHIEFNPEVQARVADEISTGSPYEVVSSHVGSEGQTVEMYEFNPSKTEFKSQELGKMYNLYSEYKTNEMMIGMEKEFIQLGYGNAAQAMPSYSLRTWEDVYRVMPEVQAAQAKMGEFWENPTSVRLESLETEQAQIMANRLFPQRQDIVITKRMGFIEGLYSETAGQPEISLGKKGEVKITRYELIEPTLENANILDIISYKLGQQMRSDIKKIDFWAPMFNPKEVIHGLMSGTMKIFVEPLLPKVDWRLSETELHGGGYEPPTESAPLAYGYNTIKNTDIMGNVIREETKAVEKTKEEVKMRFDTRIVPKLIVKPSQKAQQKTTEKPIEQIITKPIESITEKPSIKVMEKATVKPFERITEKASIKLIERPIERIIEQPIERPTERVIEQPIERIIERPIERVSERVVERSIEQVIERPVERLLMGNTLIVGTTKKKHRKKLAFPTKFKQTYKDIGLNLASVLKTQVQTGKLRVTQPSAAKNPALWRYEAQGAPTAEELQYSKAWKAKAAQIKPQHGKRAFLGIKAAKVGRIKAQKPMKQNKTGFFSKIKMFVKKGKSGFKL